MPDFVQVDNSHIFLYLRSIRNVSLTGDTVFQERSWFKQHWNLTPGHYGAGVQDV